MNRSDNKKSKLGNKYDPANLLLAHTCNFDNWSENEQSADTTRKTDKEKLTDANYNNTISFVSAKKITTKVYNSLIKSL